MTRVRKRGEKHPVCDAELWALRERSTAEHALLMAVLAEYEALREADDRRIPEATQDGWTFVAGPDKDDNYSGNVPNGKTVLVAAEWPAHAADAISPATEARQFLAVVDCYCRSFKFSWDMGKVRVIAWRPLPEFPKLRTKRAKGKAK